MRVLFDPAIDGGAWLGTDRRATAGEAWLGPNGLLDRLETELGLGGLRAPPLERAGELVAQLASRDGPWRASYDADALGTCERLLRDRDALALWGWRGEPASPRLADLWSVTAGAAPGLPDRLQGIIAALSRRGVGLDRVELLSTGLPSLWRALFARLPVVETRLPAVEPREAPLLLRPHGPLAAADEVAASLAALPSLDGVVIVGGDDVLDAALRRHGLPRLGAPVHPPASVALIRLVIEAAFEPMEPADLHALLCLDPGPIPRAVGVRLAGALSRFPGRRSPLWRDAIEDGLASLDERRRARVRERVKGLLAPAAPVTREEIARRLTLVTAWAAGRSLALTALLAARAASLVGKLGSVGLTQLRRLCDDLDEDGHLRVESEAGLAAVAAPGAVLAPAGLVVWWGFTRRSATAPPRVRLSVEERRALERFGVTPPDAAILMRDETARWRRPVELASRLILVCPRSDEAGEVELPHPLWDELRGAPHLETARLQPVRRVVPPRPLPLPAVAVSAGRPLALREQESPSSLGRLIGCSLAWALHYHGELEPGLSSGPAGPGPLLYGTLAHHFMAEVFAGGALGPDEAAARAAAVVDAELSAMCEVLDLPRYQVERATVRQAIVESARELARLVAEKGARIRGVELEAIRSLEGVNVGGRADLVLAGPDIVLDLKWSRSDYRKRLNTGTALQLAAYAELHAEGDARPEVGYFILNRHELLGTVAAGPTWRGAMAALGRRRQELAAGQLIAPAADGTEIESRLADDGLILAPECRYCSFGGLCGADNCT